MGQDEEKEEQFDADETLEIPVGDELDIDEDIEFVACDEEGRELTDDEDEACTVASQKVQAELEEVKSEYLRLYAEFDNYKKRVAKDKEELQKYANESILLDILPSLDNLEIALKHARETEEDDSPKSGLVQGVDMTLREMLRTLEKFGLTPIEAAGKPFDPEYHHAVSQAELDDMDEGMVVEDMRRGYIYNGKVIRASMVSVSKKPEARDEGN